MTTCCQVGNYRSVSDLTTSEEYPEGEEVEGFSEGQLA